MKPLLPLLFLFIYAGSTFAQVTFTKDDVLEIGTTVVYQYLDSTYLETLEFDQEGGPIEWDYTDVEDGIYKDTQTIISPAISDFPDSFPLADLAQEYVENQTNYFDCRDTGVYLVGYANGDDLFHFDSTGLLQYAFPFTYGDVNEYVKTYTNAQGQEVNVMYYTVGQAWGEITTPYGTFDCIKIVSDETRTTTYPTFSLTETSFRVTYWSPAVGDVIFYVATEYSGGGTDVSFKVGAYLIDTNVDFPTSVNELAGDALHIYPNPSNQNLRVSFDSEFSAPVRYFIYDLNGKLQCTENIESQVNSNECITIPTSDIISGNYIVVILDNLGNLAQERFVVVRH